MSEVRFGDLIEPVTELAGGEVAPFLFFDSAPASAHVNGVYSVMLSASRLSPKSDGTISSFAVAVAQLQGNREAFIALRQAIDNAFLLGAKSEGQAN